MPIGSILLGLALVVVVAPFVAGPFLKNGQRQKKLPESWQEESSGLTKQSALAALRDLDFDFRTGKVAEEDYLPLRQRLLVQAAEAVQAGEATQPSVDDEIEAAVRALRGSPRATRRAECPHCHAPVGDDDRFCPMCGTALGVTCPQCRSAVQATDKFCARCGATLKSEVVPIS